MNKKLGEEDDRHALDEQKKALDPVVHSNPIFGQRDSKFVAIPLFGQEVAPRFCFAPEVLIIGFEAGEEVSRERVSMVELPWPERMRILARRGVGVLLCGGFNRHLLPTARGLGIRVIWGLRGDAESVLKLFRTDDY